MPIHSEQPNISSTQSDLYQEMFFFRYNGHRIAKKLARQVNAGRNDNKYVCFTSLSMLVPDSPELLELECAVIKNGLK